MTLMFPKSPALRDRKYLDAVREMPCILSGLVPSDPAHIRFGGGGGMGMKPPDNHVLPLAPHLHREQHQIGERAFWRDALLLNDQLLTDALMAMLQGNEEKAAHDIHNKLDVWRDIMGDGGMFEALIALARKRYREWQNA